LSSEPTSISLRRVLILGNGGSGKSRLAERLGPALGAPVHQVDAAAVDDAWRPIPVDRRRATEAAWADADAWIIEGNGLVTLPVRTRRADTIVVLDVATARCVARVVVRRLRRRGPARPHVPGAERLRARYLLHVARFRRRVLPDLLAAARAADADVIVLRTQDEVDRFLARAR